MTKEDRDAITTFMINAVDAIFPNHREYPFHELREIEESEGDESQRWENYSREIIRAYWMKRQIEIISQNNNNY